MEKNADNDKSWGKNVGEDQIYSFLTAHYLQQDELSWSRTQTIVAIEVGIIAAAFATRGIIALVALSLGSVLILAIFALMKRDWEVRDQNLTLLDDVHVPHGIRMIAPPKYRWRRGSVILPGIIYFIVFSNVGLAIYFI